MGIFSFVKAGGKRFATIKSVKPAVGKSKIKKAIDDVRLSALKARGQMKKQSQDFDAEINKVKSKLGQTMQKLKGEPVTKSGVSKGKDLREKKMGGGMMGRRMGYQAGSKKCKVPTTPKEKAFGMLSVKKGLDNNKNITFTDKIAGATGGKKKKKA